MLLTFLLFLASSIPDDLTVAGHPAIAGVPGVVRVFAVAFFPAIAGVPGVVGVFAVAFVRAISARENPSWDINLRTNTTVPQ